MCGFLGEGIGGCIVEGIGVVIQQLQWEIWFVGYYCGCIQYQQVVGGVGDFGYVVQVGQVVLVCGVGGSGRIFYFCYQDFIFSVSLGVGVLLVQCSQLMVWLLLVCSRLVWFRCRQCFWVLFFSVQLLMLLLLQMFFEGVIFCGVRFRCMCSGKGVLVLLVLLMWILVGVLLFCLVISCIVRLFLSGLCFSMVSQVERFQVWWLLLVGRWNQISLVSFGGGVVFILVMKCVIICGLVISLCFRLLVRSGCLFLIVVMWFWLFQLMCELQVGSVMCQGWCVCVVYWCIQLWVCLLLKRFRCGLSMVWICSVEVLVMVSSGVSCGLVSQVGKVVMVRFVGVIWVLRLCRKVVYLGRCVVVQLQLIFSVVGCRLCWCQVVSSLSR